MDTSNKIVIRVLIVGTSQESCETFAKWLTDSDTQEGYWITNHNNFEIRSYIRWPGSPKTTASAPVADAMIIVAKDENEFQKVREILHEKRVIGFKILVSDNEIPQLSEEHMITLSIRNSDKSNKLIIDELIKFEQETENFLRKIFTNFDKSNDGFIDQKEIELLCKELGVDVTQSEFQETLKSLDINNDGKISFDEFHDWWRNGRQCSKLMESLINLKVSTNSFLQNLVNSKYLSDLKQKIDFTNKEMQELIHSYIGLSMEKERVKTPELRVTFETFAGGISKDNMSKAYASNFQDGFNPGDYYVCFEFTVKDPSKSEYLLKFLQILANTLRESVVHISRKFSEFVNNNVSIKVYSKNEGIICLSFKLRKQIKEQFNTIENGLHFLLDDEITQILNFNFCMNCEFQKVKSNPTLDFIDTFDFASVIEIRSEILKKNLKVLSKFFKSQKFLPNGLKFLLNSYGGSHLEFNFKHDHLKSQNKSVLKQPNSVILQFLREILLNFIKELFASFGGYNQFQKFYQAVKDNFRIVINTPKIHSILKIDLMNLHELF